MACNRVLDFADSDATWYGFVPFTFRVKDGTLLTMHVRPDVVGFVQPASAVSSQGDWLTLLLKEYKPAGTGPDFYDLCVTVSHISCQCDPMQLKLM